MREDFGGMASIRCLVKVRWGVLLPAVESLNNRSS